MFALEIIQSTTALQKLVVLFTHQILITGEQVLGQWASRGQSTRQSAHFVVLNQPGTRIGQASTATKSVLPRKANST